MKIKIAATSTGEPKLTQALKAANGKATTHTADAQDLINAAEQIEKQLESLGINKADRAGAQFRFRSGGTVSRSYKYMRKVTDVTAVRGSSAWYLTDAKTTDIWENQIGYCRLTLTEAQDAIAIAKVRSNYNVGEVAA